MDTESVVNNTWTSASSRILIFLSSGNEISIDKNTIPAFRIPRVKNVAHSEFSMQTAMIEPLESSLICISSDATMLEMSSKNL
ncbi:hypothetical protein D3C81_784230 [compost metagenome]